MSRLTLTIVMLTIAVSGVASGTDWPGYSGMTVIEENVFLAVNDRKNSSHPRYDEPGPRVTIVRITAKNGLAHEPVVFEGEDWRDPDGKPSDLEACSAIPGHPYEFLISESGNYKGRFGRIFHIRLNKTTEGKWRLSVLKAFQIYDRELSRDKSTYKGDQVEGLSCLRDLQNRLILVYAERGGKSKEGMKTARIIWGELNLNSYEFRRHGDEPLVMSSVLGGRDCSDLFIIPGNGSQIVWSVATIDQGDIGPFRSAVYRAGVFVMDTKNNKFRFIPEFKPTVYRQLDGIKVEALTAPAPVITRSGFSIGTDDENFGGIWRPLFQ